VNTGLVQQPDGTVTLNCALGKLPAATKLKVSNRGITSGWLDTAGSVEWDFAIYKPGTYQVLARSAPLRRQAGGSRWEEGNELQVTIGDKKIAHELKDDGIIPDPRNPLTPDIKSTLGAVSLESGAHHLKVEALKIGGESKLGVRLREIELVPSTE
jgi:hypothetical protein